MSTRGKSQNSRSILVFNKPTKNRLQVTGVGESFSWLTRPSVEERIDVHGVPLTIDRGLLATRSSRVKNILKNNPNEDLSTALRDMPGDWQTFEQIARFCHGYEPVLTAVNSVQILCLAHYLGMTDEHCRSNLLSKVSAFIQDKIIPNWNDSIKAVRACETVIQFAAELGLIDALMESIVSKAVSDPSLLGEPMNPVQASDEDGGDIEEAKIKHGVRRRLFDQNWQFEDLTMLSLELYEPIMLGMIHNNVSSGYIASNLSEYVSKWVTPVLSSSQIASRVQAKKVIEAVERMLPDERGLIPCTILFQMLRFADILEAGSVCKNGLELRIGKQLDLAGVSDLLIPSQGYTKELQYDVECVKRMLKIFYSSFADAPDPTGLMRVAALMEEFLSEVASDIDLKLETFVQLSELSAAASSGSQRCSDGIYRAIDIYLDKHRYLTETERDKVCQVLDCQSMSSEAMEHAAQNERLPLRIVVQAVFADQLKLRKVIAKELNGSKAEESGGELGVEQMVENGEIVKMESKVMELERECWMIRKEIESEIGNKGGQGKKKEKEKKSGGMGVWKEMKRKFGCMSSSNNSVVVNESNCQVIKKKKVHPKQ